MDITKHFSTSSFYVFPNSLNWGNTLFGGKLLAEMDCEAAKVAQSVVMETAADNVVTACIERVDFLSPAKQKDLIVMEADVYEYGRTSMKIYVKCFKKIGHNRSDWKEICTAKFVFVSMKDDKPFAHGQVKETIQSKL